MANYPETEQTYQALINLKAVDKFASFNMIFEEVKRIRLSRNLKANPSNLKAFYLIFKLFSFFKFNSDIFNIWS